MKKVIRNFLAVLAGLVAGSVVNMSLIILGGKLLPFPEGMDETNANTWPIQYFIFPLLAHALGTGVGAYTAAKTVTDMRLVASMFIGVAFLCGGIMMVRILPAPFWFIALDLLGAYLPMAYWGWQLSQCNRTVQ